MKVVHVNTSSSNGGAAIAAYRHAEAMVKAGLDSIVLSKTGTELPLAQIAGKKRGDRLYEYALFKVLERIRRPHHSFSFMTRSYGIKDIAEVQEADVVYLHWVNNFLGFHDIDWLLSHKNRVVWFLHDMWPLTGGCHHSLSCRNYLTDCSQCEQLLKLCWLAKKQHEIKMKHWFEAGNLVIASPSKWLANRAKESALFCNRQIITCPNMIDTTLFAPIDKFLAKQKLGLDSNKQYILFGAAVGAKNIYKGMGYLYEALKYVNPEYEIILMGRIGEDYPKELLGRTHQMGFITEDKMKVLIYNAADVFVIPSMAENFPNMVIEAMSCGVPTVGFNVGGIVEQITHLKTGYLAETANSESLAYGISWVLKNSEISSIGRACREYVCNICSYSNVLRNHHELLNI